MTRIKKEARAIIWPWTAVMVGGALPVAIPHRYSEPVSFVSFFCGVPLLATLSMGREFQHRTLPLWLVQPVSRRRLWCEKLCVMPTAVLSAGLVCGIVMFAFTWPHLSVNYKVVAAAYAIISIGSATYWTLTARSTVGGFALIGSTLYLFYLMYLLLGEIINVPGSGDGIDWIPSSPAGISAVFGFSTCFAANMLWLGGRKLVRYQVTGGASSEDLLTSGPSVMPEILARWIRCQPSGATLNLIRKELRLLRPLWLIELIVVTYVACFAILRLLPSPAVPLPRSVAEWALLGPIGACCIAMAGLAGALSVGEERTQGTQAWHMTLPISARRQWFIKFLVAMIAGVACAGLLPVLIMIAGGAAFGSPFMYVDSGTIRDSLIFYPILTLVCFWCACATNGTVRAAMCAAPAIAAICLAGAGGLWLGQKLAQFTGTLKDVVIASFQLSPSVFAAISAYVPGRILWLFVPTLAVGVVQSYRLFRRPPQDGAIRVLRSMLPLVIVTALWSSCASVGFVASRWEPVNETRQAIEKLQLGTATLEVTGEELAKIAPMTGLTQRWLKASTITVAREKANLPALRATIVLASGVQCKVIVGKYGATAESCAP